MDRIAWYIALDIVTSSHAAPRWTVSGMRALALTVAGRMVR